MYNSRLANKCEKAPAKGPLYYYHYFEQWRKNSFNLFSLPAYSLVLPALSGQIF